MCDGRRAEADRGKAGREAMGWAAREEGGRAANRPRDVRGWTPREAARAEGGP